MQSKGEVKLAEFTLASISKDGDILIKFSKEIEFPENVIKTEQVTATGARRELAPRELISVTMIEADTEAMSKNLKSW